MRSSSPGWCELFGFTPYSPECQARTGCRLRPYLFMTLSFSPHLLESPGCRLQARPHQKPEAGGLFLWGGSDHTDGGRATPLVSVFPAQLEALGHLASRLAPF